MALPTEHILDLCSGIGQLGLAVHDGLASYGLAGRTVGYLERDACAASLLVARMENQELDRAPVWDDLSTFDALRFAGKVSGVCAGLPCPAYSAAGKRKGNTDARAWGEGFDPDDQSSWGPVPHALRIIGECGADWAFFENVPQWLTSGSYQPVGEQLWRMGFTRQACLFVAASDVGANHKRNRAFVLAVTESWRRRVKQSRRESDRRAASGRTGQEVVDTARCDGESRTERFGMRPADQKLADSAGDGWRQGQPESKRQSWRSDADSGGGGGVEMADAGGAGFQGRQRADALCAQTATASLPIAECCDDLGYTEHGAARRGTPGETARSASRQSGRAGTGVAGVDLPLHPPARGTDLAAVAQGLSQAAQRDIAHGVPPSARHSESRRAAAAACRVARRIWRDWEITARLDPRGAAMPATERDVSVAAYGHPYATADLLRIGGNSVVRPAAAVAFAELWRLLRDE